MAAGLGGGGGQEDLPAPALSPRVDLEAALLASEPVARGGRAEQEPAPPRVRTVLIISSDADTRYYVRVCLLALPCVRVLEFSSLTTTEQFAQVRPDLFIVDRVASAGLGPGPVIVLADDPPPTMDQSGGVPLAETAWLARPFNAGSLVALVDRMLAAGREPT